MKINLLVRRYVTLSLSLFSLTFVAGLCSGDKDNPQPALIDPTDAKKVGAALIVPDGTQTRDGTPPAPSTSTQAPKVTTPVTTDQPTTNGATETLPIKYSNLTGGAVGGVYLQIEGAPTYFDIPISGNAPASGTINIPIGIPANLNNGSFYMGYCVYDRSGRVSNVIRIRFTVRRTEPLAAGKGTAVIGGRTYDATAVCDLDFAPYGRGYAIQLSQSSFLVFYNMRSGSNTLGNFEVLAANSSTGIPTSPFALYIDANGNSYWSVSGSATVSGKTVSASAVLKDLFGSQQISVSASGNCK